MPKVVLILLLILGSIIIVPVHASEIAITVRNGSVQSRMMLSFHQNVTKFPTETSTLDGTADSALLSSFTDALRKAEPSATASHLTLAIVSKPDWLNITASVAVSGITSQSGDITNTTTSWKSFFVGADLRSGNLSFNRVGKRYLRPVYDYYVNATAYLGKPNATINGITFLSNGTSIGGDQAANEAGNLTLFDFRPLNLSLSQWEYKYNLENDTTTWRYSPVPIITSSIKVTRELNITSTLFADYSYSAEIAVNGLARSHGDGVIVDVGSGTREMVMVGIVILTIIIAIWMQLIYRAKRKRVILGRR
jgi:hypothetical protein